MGKSTNGEATASNTEKRDGVNPRPLRFLVVDDDPQSRSMMDLMLSPHGYELEFACDGTEALEAIKSRSYDLVFMDLVLPDMTGRDVTRLVREWEGGKQRVPIVAVTAYDMPGQPLELVRAGMDDYIFKPYDLRGLSRIIGLYAKGNEQENLAAAEQGIMLPTADAPVLDLEGSLQDFANDIDGYKELLRDFLASLPGRLDKIAQAHAARDFERLSRECHTLKGVSAGMGAIRLSRLATQLGRCCADGRQASAELLLGQVSEAMAELQSAALPFLQS